VNPRVPAEWFWVDRWVRSSAFLLPLESRGLYREMLSQAWARGAELPADPERIQRAVGVTREEWDRTWPLVERYWKRDGIVLVNETQLEVFRQRQEAVEKAAERGRRGAAARHFKVLK
jgi:uncharacterized protein YdaU (DUF1376 family)